MYRKSSPQPHNSLHPQKVPGTNLLECLKSNPFVLAPMAGITDVAHRSFMKDQGASILITELVSATGLKFNSEKTFKLAAFESSQHPVGVQIFGESLADLSLAAKIVEELGADFIDLNFGCPVKKVVKKGAGAALLKDLKACRDVFRAVKGSTSLPVTVKIRTGWDDATKNALDLCQVAFDEGLTWVGIHGRTRSQGYSGWADWDYIKYVKENAPLPVLGNGDITSAELAVRRMNEAGVDGVMIGRGCLKNPHIFKESLQLWEQQQEQEGFSNLKAIRCLIEHLDNHWDEKRVSLQTKKFASWFSSGYPESAEFRKRVFSQKERELLFETVFDYFQSVQDLSPKDTSHESFLMGGHG